VIQGVVDKRAQARERFERAIVEGKTAALLEQERSDIFTQQIGNLPAHATLVARITVDQRLVWLPEGEWELRFPTVIGPRYIGSADTDADVRATHIKVTDAPLRSTVQISIAIKDAITGGGAPSSPSHRLAVRNGAVELDTGARLDRDIVVRWPVAAPSPGVSLATARSGAGSSLTDAFGLLTIVPPARATKPTPVPRDLVVLLDTSGSMSGFPLDKAKQVVAMVVDSLDEQDRFELIEFSNKPKRYLPHAQQATAAAKAAAIQWIRSRVADGGTEIRTAVIEAMDALRIGAQRQVIVVTDGYVGGEQQIIEAMNRRLPKSCRVHVLGVGSAVNRSLASSLARAGRGVEVIIGVDEDVERGAKRLLDRTRMPVLTNVELGGSALLRHAPALMPDCFEGSPLVAALALRPEGGELVVRGQLGSDTWQQTLHVPATKPGDGNGAIVALYGRERVADVEAHALFSTVDGEVEELGITFQIATRMTSWIAIDESSKVTGPTRVQLIPQELPYGTSAEAFGLRTAAPAMAGTRTRTASFAIASLMQGESPTYNAAAVRPSTFAGPPGGSAGGRPPVPASPARSAPAPAPATPKRAAKQEAPVELALEEGEAETSLADTTIARESAPEPQAVAPAPAAPSLEVPMWAKLVAASVLVALLVLLLWWLLG
jgi:Ca-activated chloride channel family protein